MTRGEGTRRAILEAATRLMARHGIQAVSVRQILAEADVNIALAHYHFGNRDGLIQATLAEPARALIEEWDEALVRWGQSAPDRRDTAPVLEALFLPVIRFTFENPEGANLLGQLLASPDPNHRRIGGRLFRDVLGRFDAYFHSTLSSPSGPEGPRSPTIELLTGALLLALTRSNPLGLAATSGIDLASHRALLEEMVAFCLTGLTSAGGDDSDILEETA